MYKRQIYAEGQRRYVESLSTYARQFLGQLEKPKYEHIRGLCPTVAIEGQRPILRLSGTARAFAEAAGVELAVSISHEGDIATAVVVATRCCSSHGSAHA